MSNTSASVLKVAASQLGTVGGRKYWDYVMGSGYVSGAATPWCACFVSWCFHEAGAKCAGLPAASCTYGIYANAKKAGKVVGVSSARRGDLILFDFDRNGSDAEHVGIIEEVGDTVFVCIEGNTSPENNAAGNTVARRVRAKRYAFAIIRPDYDEGQRPGKAVNSVGMYYRVHVQGLGWLPAVHDGQVAGTVGQSLRVEALKLMPPAGVTLTVNAHLQGIGWKSYPNVRRGKPSGTGSSPNDPIIGSVGERRRLEAIQLHADGLPEGKRLRYRVHVQGIGWMPWVEAGKVAGTTGKRKRLEAIQIEIV